MRASGDLHGMHRVLCIPELLDMIFSFLDPASNVVNAQTCKRWSDIALDSLWKEVDDLHQLFGILAPLRVSEELYEFDRLPESADWKRFEKYANRVRRLVYEPDGLTPPRKMKQSVFDDVARTRTRLDILPNMHTLQWRAPLSISIMFMHSGIKSFTVWLPLQLETISPRPFFQDIAARMPNLASLDVRSYVPLRCIETEMANLLMLLSKLQRITLPRYYFTTCIAETLSGLEHLGIIEFQYVPEQGCGSVFDVSTFNPSLSEGSFPALWDHSMAVTFDDASRFFNLSFTPTNITMLYIDSYEIETPTALHNLLSVIAENCQLLKFLALLSLRDASLTTLAENPYDTGLMVTMDHLKPVLKLANLTALEFTQQYPLVLNPADIELLASSWPAIETLSLNSEPVHLSQSNLTLDALTPFARHCRKLHHLGLFIDATSIPQPPIASIVPFQSLKRLSMGVSIIEGPDAVALYLSKIVPLNVKLDCGITWEESDEADDGISNTIFQRCASWERVAELLPVLTELRKEERERTRVLEKELEDSRMRVKVITDTVALGVKLDISTCVMI
ncbi:hypothetical protein GALMADRAFT_281781 [Galerina marginata CBS 339.88]|uniref:F-box domain-containing protein n=1 Tax=Galerina marginata (strain CBS 339.88) TaxID=685588 RepID=A0A067SXP7_GALM3|nr:hypothetical protein GALMADRAFT_281781 [Galerina marginata CBS 339.88]